MYNSISPVHINFGRALTTKEKADYEHLISDAKSALDIKDTTAIVFDFNVPSEKGKNVGIGSTWSEAMYKFIPFLKAMTGITSVQLQPQGKISQGNYSPYSGTNYALGTHIIDLAQLSKPEFASILSDEQIEEADKNYGGDKVLREYRTDYDYVLGTEGNDGISEKLLKQAFENFNIKLKNGDKKAAELNEEFNLFKADNAFWLEKEALFEVLTKYYGTDDFREWDYSDKNLYSSDINENVRRNRISELKSKYSEDIEYENFKQFIAFKQQKNSRKYLNDENIKLYGDCLIGFSKSELWAAQDCFMDNMYYGGPDPACTETNNIQTWGLAALDYTKLGKCEDPNDLSKLGITGKFLYDKYTAFFKRYDGIRIDAAWQFITPFIYQEHSGSYEEVKLPEIDFTVFNIMKAAAKSVYGDKFDEDNPDNIMLELVGISADESRKLTLNTYPHLYTTAYAEYDETPAKFKEKGYKDGKFYTGVGCHDNDSLVNTARNKNKRDMHIAIMQRDYHFNKSNLQFKDNRYNIQDEELKEQEDYRTAKFAEIFTGEKQFFTLPDMFGMSERINISGKADLNNWRVRIPENFERFYFSQLAKGYGLNLPKALSNAMTMKGIKDNKLIEKCNEAAEILREDGVLTEQDANIADEHGELQSKFEY